MASNKFSKDNVCIPGLFGHLLLVLLPVFMHAQTTSVLSYNIRYDNPNDGQNQWEERKDKMRKFLHQLHPEIIGIQEGLWHQVQYVDAALPDHAFIGVGRDDGAKKGEFTAIFYDSLKFKVLKEGTFWLSETPEKVSRGWDAALPRICTYALFQRRESEQKFWVFNTHFDHKGQQARIESAQLIIDQIKFLNTSGYPVVLIGDFNALPDSDVYKTITQDLKDGLPTEGLSDTDPPGTFNGFDPNLRACNRIDYGFINEQWRTVRYHHLDPRVKSNRTLSDHLPVFVILQ